MDFARKNFNTWFQVNLITLCVLNSTNSFVFGSMASTLVNTNVWTLKLVCKKDIGALKLVTEGDISKYVKKLSDLRSYSKYIKKSIVEGDKLLTWSKCG